MAVAAFPLWQLWHFHRVSCSIFIDRRWGQSPLFARFVSICFSHEEIDMAVSLWISQWAWAS